MQLHQNKKVSICLLLLGLAISGPALTAEEYTEVTMTNQRFGDWVLSCEKEKGKKKSCVMTQQVTSQSTGIKVLQANFALTEKGTQMTLLFPLGIFLPPGVLLEVEGFAKVNYAFTFCTTTGCFVNQMVEPDLLELLRQKEAANITFHSMPETPVTVPFSIKGFLDAHRKL